MKNIIIPFSALCCVVALVFALTDVGGIYAQEKEKNNRPDTTAVQTVEKERSDCLALAKEMYARHTRQPGPDSVCTYTCRVSVDLVDTTYGKSSVNDLDITIGQSRLEVVNNEVEMYRDTNDVAVVIPSTKSIYLYTAPPQSTNAMDPSQWAWMRDTLFTNGLVTECATYTDSSGAECTSMTISPDPAMRRYMEIKSISLVLDITHQYIRQVTVTPLYAITYGTTSWAFSPMVFAEAPEGYSVSVVDKVVSNAGKPRADYRGYAVHDSRHVAVNIPEN